MPMPAGTARGMPLTNSVRWAWTWKTSLALRSHLMPWTLFPGVAFDAARASAEARGIGTSSGPAAPGFGAGRRWPSDDSGFVGVDAADEAAHSAAPKATAATVRAPAFTPRS